MGKVELNKVPEIDEQRIRTQAIIEGLANQRMVAQNENLNLRAEIEVLKAKIQRLETQIKPLNKEKENGPVPG